MASKVLLYFSTYSVQEIFSDAVGEVSGLHALYRIHIDVYDAVGLGAYDAVPVGIIQQCRRVHCANGGAAHQERSGHRDGS